MNTTKLYLFIGLFVYWIICLFPPTALGDTVSNNNYSIDVGNIDTNPQPTPKPQVLGTKIISEFTTGPHYTLNTSNDSFSVKLSQNTIDFGILSSTNPVIRTSEISFSIPQSGGQLITFENHPLQSLTNDIIQNTSCDNGACTPITAALWNNTLTYGFGYRCESTLQNICDPQFSIASYFKQYPLDSSNQSPAPLMVNNVGGRNIQSHITYKVNISGTQKTGGYYNSITYLAIPNF